jgi:hypothetical protein
MYLGLEMRLCLEPLPSSPFSYPCLFPTIIVAVFLVLVIIVVAVVAVVIVAGLVKERVAFKLSHSHIRVTM